METKQFNDDYWTRENEYLFFSHGPSLSSTSEVRSVHPCLSGDGRRFGRTGSAQKVVLLFRWIIIDHIQHGPIRAAILLFNFELYRMNIRFEVCGSNFVDSGMILHFHPNPTQLNSLNQSGCVYPNEMSFQKRLPDVLFQFLSTLKWNAIVTAVFQEAILSKKNVGTTSFNKF